VNKIETALAPAMAVRVRAAVESDLAAVVALDERVTGLAKPDYFRDIFDRYGGRRRGERFFLVADGDTDGGIAGFIIGEIRAWEFGSPPCGWVFGISVDPDARMEGVGAALLDAISAEFKAAGIDRMRTMLLRNNHLLMSFFRSQGLMAGPYIELEKELE